MPDSQGPGEKEFLVPKEVAQWLGVTERTVRNWIEVGELPAFKIGKKLWRISRTDLLEWIRKNQNLGYK